MACYIQPINRLCRNPKETLRKLSANPKDANRNSLEMEGNPGEILRSRSQKDSRRNPKETLRKLSANPKDAKRKSLEMEGNTKGNLRDP